MRSLILTVLYLIKDTVHRWTERPSSPLSRLLVVFFLSLCALTFLSNYVLLTKSINAEIRSSGGDLILMTDMMFGKNAPNNLELIKTELPVLFDVETIILNDISLMGNIDGKVFPIVEYGDEGLAGLKDFPLDRFAYIALVPANVPISEGPAILNVHGYTYNLVTRRMPEGHPLKKAYERGVVLVPEGLSELLGSRGSKRYLIKVKEMTYENISRIEDTLKNIAKMDGTTSAIFSSAPILARLSVIMSNQNECRAGFAIGISVIVGILLTALASMEFRENEYVYTLMKSFGVRPILLVLTFIMENLLLVGFSFAASVYFFMKAQEIIVREFLKLSGVSLYLQDLKADLILLSMSLAICVLVSSMPIIVSAYREIGRVLK